MRSANKAVREDAISGEVRGGKKAVWRPEKLPGKLPEAGWEGGGSSPGCRCFLKFARLPVPTGGHLSGPHRAPLPSRATFSVRWPHGHQRREEGVPLAASGTPSQAGKAASKYLSEPSDKTDRF